MEKTKIIGLTGNIAGGKGVVADFLKAIGYEYFSLSEQLRGIVKRRGLENADRTMLQNIGNELRANFGPDILARLVAADIFSSPKNHFVIDGLRNTGEIELFRKRADFVLIAIIAPQAERYRRMLERKRPSDPKTWEDFVKMDNRDLGIGEEASGQQVGKCIEMADFILPNIWDMKHLEKRVAAAASFRR